MLKAVHMGDPTKKRGFSLLTISSARASLLSTLKSHGLPSKGSMHVRSSANPGASSHDGIDESSLVTLGGEYTSEITLLKDFLCSFLKFLVSTPMCAMSVRNSSSSSSIAPKNMSTSSGEVLHESCGIPAPPGEGYCSRAWLKASSKASAL